MSEKEREIAIDLDNLVNIVYNKVALWHNEDVDDPKRRGENLKFVSHEVVETILTEAFNQLNGVKTKVQVVPGEKKKEEIKEEPKKEPKEGLFSNFLKKNKAK